MSPSSIHGWALCLVVSPTWSEAGSETQFCSPTHPLQQALDFPNYMYVYRQNAPVTDHSLHGHTVALQRPKKQQNLVLNFNPIGNSLKKQKPCTVKFNAQY